MHTHSTRFIAAAGFVALVSVGSASAQVVPIDFAIRSGTHQNFRFSVFHAADRSPGNADDNGDGVDDLNGGSALQAFTGSFSALYDTQADTLRITDFTADAGGVAIELGSGVNTFDIGAPAAGAGSLISGAGQSGPRAGEASTAGLSLVIDGVEHQFFFDAFAWSSLANRFFDGDIPADAAASDDDFGIALWGLAPAEGDPFGFGADHLGFDVYATSNAGSNAVPTPSAAVALGLGGLIAARRRR